MTRIWKYAAVSLLALAIFVPAASARPAVIFRGYYGGPYYAPHYYGWYGPSYYGWYGPGYYGAYRVAPTPDTGKVKIDIKNKDAKVYVDGGYAGTVGDLKTFSLRPGSHDIEVRDRSGDSILQERVNVVAGKTTKLGE
jgi:hypothetical protein